MQIKEFQIIIDRKSLMIKGTPEIINQQSRNADNDSVRDFLRPMADYVMKIIKNLH